MRTPTTYWDYIRVEDLVSLQGGVERDENELSNDEVMFIVVHQIDELWFKLVIRELVAARDLLASPNVAEQSLASVVRGLRRMTVIFEKVAAHFKLMETMTTRDYLAFRDKLSPASGFQSAQLREIETLLGLSSTERVHMGYEGSYLDALKTHDGSATTALRRVEARINDTPNLRDALYDWVHRTPIQGSTPAEREDESRVKRFIEAYCDAHASAVNETMKRAIEDASTPADQKRLRDRYEREIQGARSFLMAEDVPEGARAKISRCRAALVFIESYRELPLLAWPREVLDAVVELEQTMLIFRQRHARMVERMIGRRTGTGGSAGVDYLDQTALKYRVFADLWAVRTLLLKREALPKLENPNFYGFAVESLPPPRKSIF